MGQKMKKITKRDIGACILFFEKASQTIDCLKSILPSGVDIYVLNNNSSQSSTRIFENFCSKKKQITIFNSRKNLGVGNGRNYLIKRTKKEWLFFIDSDIVIETKEWIEKLCNHIEKNPNIECFIPSLFDIALNRAINYPPMNLIGNKIFWGERENWITNSFPGGASLVKRSLFKRLGPYDKRIFVGFEEIELCIRGILKGEPVMAKQIFDVKLVHNHKKAITKEDQKAVKTRYDLKEITKSLNIISKKHSVTLNGDWAAWTAKDVKEMLSSTIVPNNILLHSNKIKRFIIEKARKFLNNNYDLFPLGIKNVVCQFIPYAPAPKTSIIFFNKPSGGKETRLLDFGKIKLFFSNYPSIDSVILNYSWQKDTPQDFVNITNFLAQSQKFVGVVTKKELLKDTLALKQAPNYVSIIIDNQYKNNSTFRTIFLDAKKKFKNIGFSFTLTKKNYQEIYKIFGFCDELKPAFLDLISYPGNTLEERFEPKKVITMGDKEIISFINKACKNKKYVRTKPIYPEPENQIFYCNCYNHLITMDSDLKIGCCQMRLPTKNSQNLFFSKDPFNSPELKEKRLLWKKKEFPHRECKYCFINK
jgi:GT2 family glycosyltransferase